MGVRCFQQLLVCTPGVGVGEFQTHCMFLSVGVVIFAVRAREGSKRYSFACQVWAGISSWVGMHDPVCCLRHVEGPTVTRLHLSCGSGCSRNYLNACQGAGDKGVRNKGARDKGARDKGARDKGARDKGARDKGARDKGARDNFARDNFARDKSHPARTTPPRRVRRNCFVHCRVVRVSAAGFRGSEQTVSGALEQTVGEARDQLRIDLVCGHASQARPTPSQKSPTHTPPEESNKQKHFNYSFLRGSGCDRQSGRATGRGARDS